MTQQFAYLRVLHLSPDAPAVDVFANGSLRVVQNLAFLESTDYIEVDEGVYDFQIAAAGEDVSKSLLDINDLRLSAGGYYTAVAFHSLDNIRAKALEDNRNDLASDMIRVRAIHAAASVGQVDIWNIPDDRDSGEATKLYENVDFGAVGDYVDLPAKAYTLGFDVDDDANPDLIFSLPALTAGTVANLFAVNDSQGDVILNAQFEDSNTTQIDATELGQTEIRVIHLSADTPQVDIWLNGSLKAARNLEFGQGTEYISLDAGRYDVSIAPAGTTAQDSLLDIKGLRLQANKRYTAVAYDSQSNLKAVALVDDFSGLAENQIRVRPIHTAKRVGLVDIWNLSDPEAPALLYQDLDFGDVGDYLDLPAGAYTLGFDTNKDELADALFEIPALAAGAIINVFAVANTRGALSLRAQDNLGNVDTIAASIARLRVLHISPNAPSIDVLIDDNPDPAANGLSFGESTDYLARVY